MLSSKQLCNASLKVRGQKLVLKSLTTMNPGDPFIMYGRGATQQPYVQDEDFSGNAVDLKDTFPLPIRRNDDVSHNIRSYLEAIRDHAGNVDSAERALLEKWKADAADAVAGGER